MSDLGEGGISFQKYVRKKSYVKCIDNRPYLKLPHLPEQQEPLVRSDDRESV